MTILNIKTQEQKDALLERAKKIFSKYSHNKMCNFLGLRKEMFEDLRLSGKVSTGYSFGDYIQLNTESLRGYFYKDSGYSIRLYLMKDYSGELVLCTSTIGGRKISLTNKEKKLF